MPMQPSPWAETSSSLPSLTRRLPAQRLPPRYLALLARCSELAPVPYDEATDLECIPSKRAHIGGHAPSHPPDRLAEPGAEPPWREGVGQSRLVTSWSTGATTATWRKAARRVAASARTKPSGGASIRLSA